MQEMDNMANGSVIRGPLGPGPSAFLTDAIQIPNRKSGIRIRPKSLEISTLQISNRKYSPLLRSPRRIAILDRGFCRSRRFLIYGCAIKASRNTLKKVSHRNF
jgi:hypothetical protein